MAIILYNFCLRNLGAAVSKFIYFPEHCICMPK